MARSCLNSQESNEYSDINDSVIIQKQIDQLKEIADNEKDSKKQLILEAAALLETKYEDKSVICSSLQSILAKDKPGTKGKEAVYALVSKQYIQEILPDKYKRKYERPDMSDPHTPANLAEEIVFRLDNITQSMQAVTSENRKKLVFLRNSKKPQDQKLYKEVIHKIEQSISHDHLLGIFNYFQKQMSDIRHLDQFIEFLKEIESNVKSLRRMSDERQKYSTALKLNLKIAFVSHSYDHIASDLFGSKYGKWASMIDKSYNVQKLCELVKCPNCGLDAERYIEKAKSNQEMGLPLPDYADFSCK